MSEDHSAPTYGISITYNVGSHNERAGRTGFAHLFEHMMFEGSENVGKGEHMILVENNGGDMNGTTTEDRTNYFESFASNQLDLGLFLESDRMRSLAVNQANLDNQRNAVQEERRLSVDNQPYGETSEVLQGLIYDNFANKHSVIGSMQDLNAATIKDVQDFFRIYYAPNNAVLTLVGDFQPAEALAKIKKYFGDIPAQPAPPAPDLAEPKQTGERTQDHRGSVRPDAAPGHRVQDASRQHGRRVRAGRSFHRSGRRPVLAALSEPGEGQGTGGECVLLCRRAPRPIHVSTSLCWRGPAKT